MSEPAKPSSLIVKGVIVTALAVLANVAAADSEFTLNQVGHSQSESGGMALPNGAVSHTTSGPGECDDPCAVYTTGGIVADFRVYDDPECRNQIDNPRMLIDHAMKICPNKLLCYDAGRDGWPQIVYMQAGGGFPDGAQLAFTINKDCWLGPNVGYVTAVLSRRSRCLRVGGINTSWGMNYMPCGSLGLVKGRSLGVDEGNVTDSLERPTARKGRQARMLLDDD